VGTIALLSASDPFFNWTFFWIAGVAPVALIWGVAWVAAGFRSHRDRAVIR
jgi:hypothetical protein